MVYSWHFDPNRLIHKEESAVAGYPPCPCPLPTMAEVNAADRVQLIRWYRSLSFSVRAEVRAIVQRVQSRLQQTY